MTMWNWMTPATLIDLQRKAALGHMGEQARILLRQGYAVEADRILDEICVYRDKWESEVIGGSNNA